MQANGKTGLAILFIGFGALILLDKIGLGLGGLIALLFPIALIALGAIGIRNGSTFLGWSMVVIGAVILLGKLSGLIGLLLAAGLIVYGFSLLKKRKNAA